jgi:hypothetical protein
MKPKTKLTIVNPSVANLPAITPPPRKEDIINAMVERARVKHIEESQRLEALRATAESKLDAAVKKNFDEHPENFTVRIRANYQQPDIVFEMVAVPPSITKLKAELRECKSLRCFDEVAVKRQIREGVNLAGSRVKALLDNPAAVKALDAALEKM